MEGAQGRNINSQGMERGSGNFQGQESSRCRNRRSTVSPGGKEGKGIRGVSGKTSVTALHTVGRSRVMRGKKNP